MRQKRRFRKGCKNKSRKVSGRYGLFSVFFSYKTTMICGDTFSGCSDLKTLRIPNQVVEIGRGAFKEYTACKKWRCYGNCTSVYSRTFLHGSLNEVRRKFFRKLFVYVEFVVLNKSTVEDNSVLPVQVCMYSFI